MRKKTTSLSQPQSFIKAVLSFVCASLLTVVYVLTQQKGFPLDTTLDQVKEWLSDKEKIENIHMRKGATKTFKVRDFEFE